MNESSNNAQSDRSGFGEAVTNVLRQPSFLRVMLFLAATVVVLVGLRLGAPILNPILFAVVLTLLFSPVYSWLLRRGLPAPLALLGMLVLLTVLFLGLIFIVGGSISRFTERVGFYTTQLHGQVDSLDALIERLGLSNVDVRDVVKPKALTEAIGAILSGIAGFLSDFFLILVIMLFLLAEGPAMMDRLRASASSDNPQVASLTTVGRSVVRQFLAASVAVQNAVFVGTGAPAFGDPLGEVLAYHAENRGAVAVAVGQEAVNLPLLLLFVTGLHGLVQRRGGAGADWSRLAVAAGATLSAVFALVMTTHIAVVLAADGLAEPTPAFELVWQLHAAAFALALPALGATFIGAALATHASGLTRPWQRLLGVAGGSLLILAGYGNLAIADGSPLLFVGVAGFAAWLVWLVVTGLRLIIRGQG